MRSARTRSSELAPATRSEQHPADTPAPAQRHSNDPQLPNRAATRYLTGGVGYLGEDGVDDSVEPSDTRFISGFDRSG